MTEIRNLTRNGETFYPLTHEKAVIGMEEFKDTITTQISQYQPIEITGDVVNAPDEEDITSDNNLLKFKNRNNLYGLGKVILRRGSSFASQVTQANTIYVIQYNFDLDNGRINVPNGSILLFEGGTLSNGTLVCADLYDVRLVYYQDQSEILSSVTLEGNFIHKACDKDTIRQILVDNSSITKDANDVLSVKANGIQNIHLNSNTVDNSSVSLDTNNKISIKDGGVTGNKLNSGIVNTDDLSIVSNKIQLTDRGTTNGMGMIILRKDLSFASQLTQQNTIYIIRYDFILTGDVTIPANCILKFEGGSISGAYTITGQNTGIEAGLVKIFDTNVTLAGSWNVEEAYPEWFGAKGDGVNDDTAAIQKCINTFNYIVFTGEKTYEVSSSVTISNKVIDGKAVYGHLPKIETNVAGITMFVSQGSEFKGLDLRHKDNSNSSSKIIKVASGDYIHSCFIMGGYDAIYCDSTCDGLKIDKCYCWNASGHAWLYLNVSQNYLAAGVKITNCHLNFQNSLDSETMKYGLILYRCEQSSIENCIINQADINIVLEACREVSVNNCHMERTGLPGNLTKAVENLSISNGMYLYNTNNPGIIYKAEGSGTLNTLNGWGSTIGTSFTVDGISILPYKQSWSIHSTGSNQTSFNSCSFCNLACGYLQGAVYINSCEAYGAISHAFVIAAYSNISIINCNFGSLDNRIPSSQNTINLRVKNSTLNDKVQSFEIERQRNAYINESKTISFDDYPDNSVIQVDPTNNNITIKISSNPSGWYKKLTFVRIVGNTNYIIIETPYGEGRWPIVLDTYGDSVTVSTVNLSNYYNTGYSYYQNINKRRGNSTNRPSLSNKSIGFQYFDSSLSPARPIYWNGTAWVDATGNQV